MSRGKLKHFGKIWNKRAVKMMNISVCIKINVIQYGKCFNEWYIHTRWFRIKNPTCSLRSLVRFLIRQQLVCKYFPWSIPYFIYTTEVVSTINTYTVYCISENKHLKVFLKFWLKWEVLIERRVLKQRGGGGGVLIKFSLCW